MQYLFAAGTALGILSAVLLMLIVPETQKRHIKRRRDKKESEYFRVLFMNAKDRSRPYD